MGSMAADVANSNADFKAFGFVVISYIPKKVIMNGRKYFLPAIALL
jgi:hypothetical protein